MEAALNGRTAATMREKPRFPPFTAPPVDVGTPVLFFTSCERGNHPLLGEVSAANRPQNGEPARFISIMVTTPGGVEERDSVMHVDDPRCADPRVKERGAWDFRPPSGEQVALLNRIDDLEARLAELEEGLGQSPAPAKGRAKKGKPGADASAESSAAE